jgi:HTH-type transcriptional regulator/antitoxin HigA
MEIRPIKNQVDYDAALARIDALFDAGIDTPEGDELDILVTLVEAYEAKHYPIDSPDPIEAIKFRMKQMGLERKDLEPYIGRSGRVSEILNHDRPLTLRMIRNLWTGLHIPLESLVGVKDNPKRHA